MKTISHIYQKIASWLFRDSLDLNKHWWHRLIKVIFLLLFIIVMVSSYIAIIADPERDFLVKHNISIKNTLYEFTKNYTGDDRENTIPNFFEQKGSFGIQINNKIEYISEYSLGKSMCFKNPEKYLDYISKVLYADYIKNLSFQEASTKNSEDFYIKVKEMFYEDTSRKCYFYDLDSNEDNFKGITNLSANIINYRPSAIFYLEATLLVPLVALAFFIFFALVYYRLILYIVYGNKK